jgi:hypothetical protein
MAQRNEIDYTALTQALAAAQNKDQLYRAIVDAPFHFKIETALMSLGILVLLIADKKTGVINRVALSDTELAKGTTTVSVKRFEDIVIPLEHEENVIAQAISKNKPLMTTDWYYLFTPALSAEEARFNQAGGAIACSAVYPLADLKDGGALIFSYYQYLENIGSRQSTFMKRYSKLVADTLQGANHAR